VTQKPQQAVGYIGINASSVLDFPDLARVLPYGGVLVAQTYANTPAAGRLQNGDIITHISEEPVKDATDFQTLVAATTPGTNLPFTVIRNQQTIQVMIRIGERPAERQNQNAVAPNQPPPVVQRPAPDPILGVWMFGQSRLVFQPQGKCVWNGYNWSYGVHKGLLTLEGQAHKLEYNYEVRGNQLIFRLKGRAPEIWTRCP
jgi:hypothetical protein